jgi:hypothetical protein
MSTGGNAEPPQTLLGDGRALFFLIEVDRVRLGASLPPGYATAA